ncbi:MAG: L,D-transpeptidase family protein [Clostridia bacterium]|nr:L,D-transpeptidase family protein [Clostridia bacterium]
MIRIIKHARTLEVISPGGDVLFTAKISLGKCPDGAKTREGDMKTPEGKYRITHKNPGSKYHIALGISYPSGKDAYLAQREGRISKMTAMRILLCDLFRIRPPWKTKLGGFIMIHGEHPDALTGDWTAGCIAVKNSEIEKIAKLVKRGETVEILK